MTCWCASCPTSHASKCAMVFDPRKNQSFYYKSRALIEHGDKDLWMVDYTEWVTRMWADLRFSAYDVYCLWYVTADIIPLVLDLGMAMEVLLAMCENVREVFEMLGIIESTGFREQWTYGGTKLSGPLITIPAQSGVVPTSFTTTRDTERR